MFKMMGIEEQVSGYLSNYAGVIGISSLVWYALFVIGCWRVFTKAGEKGWKAIIPFYNIYIIFKIAWNKKIFWIPFIVTVVAEFIMFFAANSPVMYGILDIAVSVFAVVIDVMLMIRLAKVFGKGKGFAVGLVLLNTIFVLILGFGKSEYIGSDKAVKIQQ